MRCHTVKKLQSQAYDRLLPEAQEAQFHTHLVGCPACRKRYQQLGRLLATLSGTARVAAPESLDSNVRAIWHPTLRPIPSLRLYPYLRGHLIWELRRLRLAGHFAGLLVTLVIFGLTLNSFGNFPLEYARIAGPGIYTHMTRAPLNGEFHYWTIQEGNPNGDSNGAYYEAFLYGSLTARGARLNDHTLSRFARGELDAVHEDSFSVITTMDADGRGAIEGVLHSPRDPKLFVRFGQLLSTTQFDMPPAQSGASGKGRVVWSFSRVIVTS